MTGIQESSFGQMIRAARNKAGFSLREAAPRIGIGFTTLNSYELNREGLVPRREVIRKMVRIYKGHVSYSQLKDAAGNIQTIGRRRLSRGTGKLTAYRKIMHDRFGFRTDEEAFSFLMGLGTPNP